MNSLLVWDFITLVVGCYFRATKKWGPRSVCLVEWSQNVLKVCERLANRQRGLCRPYFFTWKKRLQESAAARYLEVQVTERVTGTVGDAGIEIRLQNGRSLMVRPGFDAGHVRALLAVAETVE